MWLPKIFEYFKWYNNKYEGMSTYLIWKSKACHNLCRRNKDHRGRRCLCPVALRREAHDGRSNILRFLRFVEKTYGSPTRFWHCIGFYGYPYEGPKETYGERPALLSWSYLHRSCMLYFQQSAYWMQYGDRYRQEEIPDSNRSYTTRV